MALAIFFPPDCVFSRYIGLVIQIDGRELRRNQVENPLRYHDEDDKLT